jgi:hypothetical protein
VQTKRLIALLAGVLLPGFSSPGLAAPFPPCGAAPIPDFGSIDAPPRAEVWSGDKLRGWQPPSCLGWDPGGRLVAALASRFHSKADAFQRLSDIKAWPQLQYWSISHQAWRPLALAVSLSEQQPIAGWPQGKTSLFSERDENTGEATYRLTVLERRPERLVLATENVSPIKLLLITAFEPKALQTVTFVEREASGVWTSYQITRVGNASSQLALSHASSFLNRLEALRRHLAGLSSTDAPPIAPH